MAAGYEYEVQGFYYGDWEMLTTEDDKRSAMEMLKCYNENEPDVPHRIKRVKSE